MDGSSIPNSEPPDRVMYQVDVADNQDCLELDRERLVDIVRTTLEAEQVAAATISLAVVDNPTIHELNRQYLEHDYETDVLSFLLDCSGGGLESSTPRGAGKTIDGEIIVSTEYAKAMAPEFDWEPIDELTLYIVHGLLHLCGYDDLSEDEVAIMRTRERHALSRLGIDARSTERGETVGREGPATTSCSREGDSS